MLTDDAITGLLRCAAESWKLGEVVRTLTGRLLNAVGDTPAGTVVANVTRRLGDCDALPPRSGD